MNEPKKRGRPSKAEIAARLEGASVPVINGDTHREPEDVIDEQKTAAVAAMQKFVTESIAIITDSDSPAQAYAMRVWNGQSSSADRPWRIERVKAALEGQGLSYGVVLP